jgi:hypothetical protein
MAIVFFMLHTSIFHLHQVPYYFDSSLLQVFGHLLSSGSFNKGPLARKQASFPITFRGIISTSYLRSWAFVILVIAARFIVDHHPFLLKALAQVDNNTFPFQQHLRTTCDLLPPLACVCVPPF